MRLVALINYACKLVLNSFDFIVGIIYDQQTKICSLKAIFANDDGLWKPKTDLKTIYVDLNSNKKLQSSRFAW